MNKEHETLLKVNERVDDLQLKGLKIIQNPKGFCYGIDAVLISNFCEVRKNDVVVDLGTGTGIIPILIAGKSEASKIYGIEIQEEVAEMAIRSVSLNNLNQRISIVNDNLCNGDKHIKPSSVDVVVSNPPYVSKGAGLINPKSNKAISRHEIHCTIEDVIQTSANLLKQGGSFFMVHRPSRLVDIIYYARKYNLEPKLIRFVHPRVGTEPNILLIKCVKNSGAEIKFMDPLFVYDSEGNYTDEINDIYKNESIDPNRKGSD